MKIGIIGAGAIGTAIARALANAGIDAIIANRRGPDSLAALEGELGPHIRAATVREAASADIVFLAVNWSKIPDAVRELGPWGGRIVIDANNPIEAPTFRPFDLGGRASSEVVADLLPGARLVKAFNHLPPALLASDPRAEGGRRVLFVAGDNGEAKAEVLELIERMGFFGIDLGTLGGGGRLSQFPGGPLPSLNLVKFDKVAV
ncbi:NADP oxidoreductase [Massilia dura]|uniref:NADP oxidoreductase n=1 Tax=Pseudoduganella dura TaxID=321982 RepID=A0A6I3XND2_9BURK|nr:NAD(P)-binding domain-containing protein [Pseudoduganella dura]MUI14128.1 NADP oxidoreductase [Pseudoduganella dura]GGX76908.1 NADP oxidoreductase [Pseudoduganella dura]